jgi:hypothetical protein
MKFFMSLCVECLLPYKKGGTQFYISIWESMGCWLNYQKKNEKKMERVLHCFTFYNIDMIHFDFTNEVSCLYV